MADTETETMETSRQREEDGIACVVANQLWARLFSRNGELLYNVTSIWAIHSPNATRNLLYLCFWLVVPFEQTLHPLHI